MTVGKRGDFFFFFFDNNVRTFILKNSQNNQTKDTRNALQWQNLRTQINNDQEGQKGINKNMKAKLRSIRGEYGRKNTLYQD